MRYIYRLLAAFVLSCIAMAGFAQQIPVRNYTMRDGLSHANVFRITQDARGFMVFSTAHGVSVFDSKVFHNYTRREGLPHNTVISASQYGRRGQVLSTYGGGLALLTENGIAPFPLKGGEMPANVIAAGEHAGALWLIGRLHTPYRLYCIRDGVSRPVDVQDSAGGQVVFQRMQPAGQELLLTTKNGLYRLDPEANLSRLWPGIIQGEVIDAWRAEDGSYWVAQKERLLHVARGRIEQSLPFSGEASVSDLLLDRSGKLWIGTLGDGLYAIDEEGLVHYSAHMALPKTIINDLYEDGEGSIWIATHGKGVYRLDGTGIISFAPEPGMMNAYCTALQRLNDSEVVTASMGTLSIYRRGRLRAMHSAHIRRGDYVYFIAKRGEELMIGTPNVLLMKSIHPPYAERVIPFRGKAVSCISWFEDSRKRVWAGSFGQLYVLAGDSLVQQPMHPPQRINAIGEDASGNIWLGTDSGLLVDRQGCFVRDTGWRLPADTRVNQIYRDSYNRLWFATAEGLMLSRDTGMMLFSTRHGLTHNKCNAIAEGTGGRLWVGTINGVSLIDLATLRIRDYRSRIYPNEVLSLLPLKEALLVGLVDGLSVMKHPSSEAEPKPPPLFVKALRTGTRSLAPGAEIRLPYWDNKLTVEFIAVAYRNADMIGYRYRVEGLDKDWHYTSGSSVSLSALPSGNYTLLLSASQSRGGWSEPVRLGIHVTRPIWKEWWLIGLAALMLLLAVYRVTRALAERREQAKLKQLATFNKIAYLKQQALSALINPHFIFNCMNSIQHYLNRHDNDAANEYLADFAELIRQTMEQAQQAFISLEEEIGRLRIYLSLEQMRFGEDLRYEFWIDPAINPMRVRIPNMILQPFIENAIIHGIMPKRAPGFISVRFRQSASGELEISIEDDGVGFRSGAAEKRLHHPYGIRLTEERLQMLSGLLHQLYQINIVTKDGSAGNTGTIVILKMPIAPDEEKLRDQEPAMHGS